jgi:hypothetical protein
LLCDDAEAAQQLETRLAAHDAALKTAQLGPWVTLQRSGDPAAFFDDLWK